MDIQDMTVGTRVRLTGDAEIFDTGIFPAGLIGTVVTVEADAQPGEIRASVRLDLYFPALQEWHNELQVFDDGEGLVDNTLFERI